MGAEHRVATSSFDGSAGSGGYTYGFGPDQGLRGVNTTAQDAQNYNWGFGYGTAVTGTPGPDSYLWSATAGQGSALPYAEVYLRPRLRSANLSFPAIPECGSTPTAPPTVPNSAAIPNTWGVSGISGDPSSEGSRYVR